MRRIFALMLFALPLFATKYAGEPFSVGFGGRALGLGGSFTAIGEDASTVYWNPAGLSNLKKRNILFMHGSYFDGAENQEFIVVTLPDALGKERPLGVSLYLLNVGGIKATELAEGDSIPDEENVRVVDTLSMKAYRLTLSSSKEALGGQVGATLKFIAEDLSVTKAWGVGLDIGYLYRKGPVGLGFLAKDVFTTPLFWDSDKRESINPSIRMGLSYRYKHAFLFSIDLLLLTEGRRAEAPIEVGLLYLEPHLGAEFSLSRYFAFRAGLDAGNFTFGVGLKVALLSLDYAFLAHSELGGSHRVSLNLRI
jgi:hypothetical protein